MAGVAAPDPGLVGQDEREPASVARDVLIASAEAEIVANARMVVAAFTLRENDGLLNMLRALTTSVRVLEEAEASD